MRMSTARSQKISGKYIHVIVSGLRAADLVRTVRGPNGGYEPSRKPSPITALDVIRALEGKCAPVDCLLAASACSRATGCSARDVWCEVATAVDRVLSGVTLDRLAASQRDKQDDSPDFCI